MSDEQGAGKGFVMGFITGTMVGSIVALLYAPKSGKELRTEIKTKSDEYLDEAETYLENAKVKANELIHDGKKKVRISNNGS